MKEYPGVIGERGRIRSLNWFQSAIDGYTSRGEPTLLDQIATDIRRCDLINGLVDRMCQPGTSIKPNVLMVGVGMYTKPLFCTVVPQSVAAHLQAKDSDYQLTLVDISHDVIEDVRERRTLFFYPPQNKVVVEEVRRSWQNYLEETQQSGRVIYGTEDGLRFNQYDLAPRMGLDEQRYLGRGIWAADVPSDFHTGISDGRIRLLEGDIALVDFRGSQPFDLVQLTEVLYMLNPYGQQLALANVAGHMREGGHIIISDYHDQSSVLSQFGGWLSDEKLRDLNLIRGETLVSDDRFGTETFLLTKTSNPS